MSQITLIYWFFICENDPDYQNFPNLIWVIPEWPQSLDSYHFQTIKISKITWMSEITLINWFIIWANDPDYQNFPNYLNDHNPWTHIILKWSKFSKIPKCPKLPWSTDSYSAKITQITKISQITWMTTILELKSLSNWLKF